MMELCGNCGTCSLNETPLCPQINLNFIHFKLDKPNDCEANFVDVFSTRTDLPSRLKNFCGSIADSVTSELNVLHVRFYADYSAKNSSFDSLFTAFREKGTGKRQQL